MEGTEARSQDDLSSKEAPKTWGFRRSTIARREFMEEIGDLDLVSLTPRRGGRQSRGKGRGRGRGRQVVEEPSPTAKRGRGRRISAPVDLDSTSGHHTETAAALPQPSSVRMCKLDIETSDSDELTLRELQERVRNRKKTEEKSRSAAGSSFRPVNDANEKAHVHLQSKEDRKDESSDDNGEDSDPNAVYCVCRQTHNNRFMICCDRCQEWFHGDCVGISEARGLLLEKNGEDYICPSCSPCPSPIICVMQPVLCKTALSSSSEDLCLFSAGEEGPSEDKGIKGKIRKASGHSIKKKIKIFQPVEVIAATLDPRHEVGKMEKQGMIHRLKQEETEEPVFKELKAAFPKCIGPGCNNDALPESVYCGHQCIIRHASLAMQGLSEPKPQPELKAKPAVKPALKIQNLGKLFKRKPAEKPAEEEDGRSKEEEESVLAAPLIPDPAHKANGVQQPAAIAPSVFYKSTTTREEKMGVEVKVDKKLVTHQTEAPTTSALSLTLVAERAVDITALAENPTAQRAAEKTATSDGPTAPKGPEKAALPGCSAAKEPAMIAAASEGPAALKASEKAVSLQGLTAQKEIAKAASPEGPATQKGAEKAASSQGLTTLKLSKTAASSEGPFAQKPSEKAASSAHLAPQKAAEKTVSNEGQGAQKVTEKAATFQGLVALKASKSVALSEGLAGQNPSEKAASSSGPVAQKAAQTAASSEGLAAQKGSEKTAPSECLSPQKLLEKAASSESQAAQKASEKAASSSGPSAQKGAEKESLSEGSTAQKPSEKAASSENLGAQKGAASPDGPVSKKLITKPASLAPPVKNPLTSRAKKTMPGSPRLAGSRQLQTEAPQVSKNVSTAPKIPCQPETSKPPQTSSPTPETWVLPVTPAPVPPSRPLQAHPNMQMRQNIRRSLTDTLLKRVNDSDDLDVPESDLEKLAVNIEREMFNMYYTTDNKYKTKYRSLLLSLKDPRNKGLFYQVVKGLITPFKLTRLTQEELLSVQDCTANPLPQKEELFPVCLDTDKPLPVCENKVVKCTNVAISSENKMSVPQVRPAQAKKVGSAVSDIISSMLKDTTAEHKMHLFDVKCRICTGQISGSEDPETKRLKREEPKAEEEEKPLSALSMPDKIPAPAADTENSLIMESPASPTSDDSSAKATQPDFTPPVIPAVSIVTITRRDPRTAANRSSSAPSANTVPTSTPAPEKPHTLPAKPKDKETVQETKTPEPQTPPLPSPPPPPMPRSILMKPLAPSVSRFYSSSSPTTRLASLNTSANNETSQFLSKQETVWKGFLNMQTVAKFVTKGCIISGSAEILKKDLPDTIHVGGRIAPQTVWEYVERVKTSVTKELSLIRFHPASDEEEVAYVSLFSYFNSRRRFGVVSNISNNIKDLYLIPLGSNQSIPSILLPLDGPGLEQNHPNLLIGLAVCQKLKRPGSEPQEVDGKKPKLQTSLDPEVLTLPNNPAEELYDPAIPLINTPPGSPPSLKSPDSSSSSFSSLSGPSVLSSIPSLLNPLSSVADISELTASSVSDPSSSSSTPLQTILQTLFGKKQQSSDITASACEPSPSSVRQPLVPVVDPIVQRYQQTPKSAVTEEINIDDNDRPYDPEEEYDPSMEYKHFTLSEPAKPNKLTPAVNEEDDDRPYDPEEEYNLGNKLDSVSLINATKSVETEPPKGATNDVAYDPEDETVFAEMQSFLADGESSNTELGIAPSVSLSEQQRMLEELNRQIEEQKRQLAEQEEALRLQRAAVGVSMAHFSVSDALMSPPPCFGRESDEIKNAVSHKLMSVHTGNENDLDESREKIKKHEELTQATFLTNSSHSVVQELFSTDQENNALTNIKKDPDRAGQVDKKSTKTDKTELRSESSTHSGASEGTSSSGNLNKRRSRSSSNVPCRTSRSRSHTSRQESHGSPKRRTERDRRSYYDRRSSDDGHHRRGRNSPERSSRRSRSRSRSRRRERASSRQRDRHSHRDTSSRRRRSRDRHHSTKSSSSRSRTSDKPEDTRSDQRRQSTESAQQSNESNQSTNQVVPAQPQTQGSKSQGKTSEDKHQVQKSDESKPEADQSRSNEAQSTDPLSGTVQFSHREQTQLKPSQTHQVQTSEAAAFQRDDLSQDASENFQDKNKLQSESYSKQSKDELKSTSMKNETDFHTDVPPMELQSMQEPDHKSQLLQNTCNIPMDSFKGCLDTGDFVGPKDETQYLRDNPQNMHHQNREASLSISRLDFPSQGTHPMERVNVSHVEHTLARNFHPKDQFRPRAPDFQWRGPQYRTDGPRGPIPVQAFLPRVPHPERFESHGSHHAGPWSPSQIMHDDSGPSQDSGRRDTGTVAPRKRMFDESGSSPEFSRRDIGTLAPIERMYDDSGPSSDFGQMDAGPVLPRQRLSDDSVPFSDVEPRNAGRQIPRQRLSDDSRPFPEPAMMGAGPRIPRQSIRNDFEPSPDFNPRHPHLAPEMLEDPENQDCSMFEGPKHRLQRPGKLEGPGPQSLRSVGNRGIFKGEFDFPGVPQRQYDQRDPQLPDFNTPRRSNAPYKVDRETISDFSHPGEHCNPPQFSDQPRRQNIARNIPPHHVQRQRTVQPRFPRCKSPPHNQPREPQFLELEEDMEEPHYQEVDEFGDQEIRRELPGPPIMFTEGRGCERDAQMRGPHFNPSQDFRGPRAPVPLLSLNLRMPAHQNKEFEERPNIPLLSNTKGSSQNAQRPWAPAGGQILMQPRIPFDGSAKQPKVLPLRLSGPLLPTPPGGPIRLHNPRMAKAPPYNRPQGHPGRGPMNDGAVPGSFNASNQKGQTSQSFNEEEEWEEYTDGEEEHSSQESSPGKRRHRRLRRGSRGAKRPKSRGRGKHGAQREMPRRTEKSAQ